MNLKPMFLGNNKEEKQDASPRVIPDWLDKDAEYLEEIDFEIESEYLTEAFEAVKNSKLPQEVIDYLTQHGDFDGVMLAAGFAHYDNYSKPDYSKMEPRRAEYMKYLESRYPLSFAKYKPLLGIYESEFLSIIAPYVVYGSYLQYGDDYDVMFRYVFKNSKYEWIEPDITWEY